MNKLNGIYAKINRAGDQIDLLTTDMDRFCTDIRQSIVREVREDSDEQVWVYHGETPSAPIEWSVRVGEILYNLRSALDHLVSQLLLANGQEPSHQNAYPIVNEESEWSRNKHRLKGVMPRVEFIVERLQPYTGGLYLPFDVSVFRTLHTLCNIDKHQRLHRFVVQTSGIGPIDFGENHPPLNRPSASPPLQGRGLWGKIEKGKVLSISTTLWLSCIHPFKSKCDLRMQGKPKSSLTPFHPFCMNVMPQFAGPSRYSPKGLLNVECSLGIGG
ncbi:MAG: hypothetical protein OXI53_00015 [Nitrospira sp.]|nr:hypothetical protein [Nitrospira sp.]MDE0403685.1 hypothetical protein [Nitrospira sp.]